MQAVEKVLVPDRHIRRCSDLFQVGFDEAEAKWGYRRVSAEPSWGKSGPSRICWLGASDLFNGLLTFHVAIESV